MERLEELEESQRRLKQLTDELTTFVELAEDEVNRLQSETSTLSSQVKSLEQSMEQSMRDAQFEEELSKETNLQDEEEQSGKEK